MKVYVTGIGCISGIGTNVKENLEALQTGRNGLDKISLFTTRHQVPVAEVKQKQENLLENLGIPSGIFLSRTALLGITAAQEAWLNAGIKTNDKLRIGVISSTSTGGMDRTEKFYPAFRLNKSEGRLKDVVSHDAGDSTERIASHLGLNGFRTTISTACSSAANAILLGGRMIRQGLLDVVIAGGTDALCQFTVNGFASLMILDKETCRPFDADRAGLNLGEGAGYLVLQSETSLQRTPYCELAGYANTNDAYHQTASSPEGTGAWMAMKNALDKAGIRKEEVDYINAHGTGTPNNDASESMAIKRLFGEVVPPFSSTKGATGHTLGAAGGLEAVFCALAIDQGILFPNLNFSTPIPETGLVPVTTCSKKEIYTVLSNSFGFGGNNTSLVFRKYIS